MIGQAGLLRIRAIHPGVFPRDSFKDTVEILRRVEAGLESDLFDADGRTLQKRDRNVDPVLIDIGNQCLARLGCKEV